MISFYYAVFFILLNRFFIFSVFPLISPKKNDTPKPIIANMIDITDARFAPNTQLLFNTFGIIDINSPNITENVAV